MLQFRLLRRSVNLMKISTGLHNYNAVRFHASAGDRNLPVGFVGRYGEIGRPEGESFGSPREPVKQSPRSISRREQFRSQVVMVENKSHTRAFEKEAN